MPLTFTTHKTPKDRTFVRTVSSGTITAEDTKGLMNAIAPGQPLAAAPMLSIIEPGADYTPEARKSFTSMGQSNNGSGVSMPVAIVVPNAAMRVLISFILKIAGAGASTKFFGNEDDAKAWLFSIVDAS